MAEGNAFGADYNEGRSSQSAWRPQGNALQLFYQQAMGIPGSQMARTNGRYPDYNFGGGGFGFGAPDIAGGQPGRGGKGGGPDPSCRRSAGHEWTV